MSKNEIRHKIEKIDKEDKVNRSVESIQEELQETISLIGNKNIKVPKVIGFAYSYKML